MTTMPRTRGSINEPLATLFLETFAIGDTITLADFDKWGWNQRLYVGGINPISNDEMNAARTALRLRVNSGANAAQRQMADPDLCFSVEVDVHGKTYEVRPAPRAFTLAAKKLPKAIGSLLLTKRKQLKILLGSVDMRVLPGNVALAAERMDDDLSEYEALIMFTTAQAVQKFNKLVRAIDRLDLKGTDGGIAAMLEKPKPADDDDGDDDEADAA